MFELFAVPYRVLGNDATALRLTTLLFNTVVAAVLVLRRGTAAVLAIGMATVLLIWGLPPGALSFGWSVTVTDLAGAVLVGSPSPELAASADALPRLEKLRRVPGIRYGLYVVES